VRADRLLKFGTPSPSPRQPLRPVVRTWMPAGWEVRMPGEPPQVAEMESFLAERGEKLLRTAIFLTRSRNTGEDLLQAALERLFRNWRKIHGDPEGYLRRIDLRDQLVRLLLQLPPRQRTAIVLGHIAWPAPAPRTQRDGTVRPIV
jgi:hypothetical protein